jgi:hypothetical protein
MVSLLLFAFHIDISVEGVWVNHERSKTYFQNHLQLTGALEDAEFSFCFLF